MGDSALSNRPLFPQWASVALVCIVAVGTSFVIWSLAEQNRDLKAMLAGAAPPSATISPGDVLPSVSVTNTHLGTRQLESLVANGGVIVFLTTTCPYCRETLPVWSELSGELARREVPFVAISFHDRAVTDAYAQATGTEWDIWTFVDPADAPRMDVPSVPMTLLVSSGGVVVESWRGRLTGGDAIEVLDAVGQIEADRVIS